MLMCYIKGTSGERTYHHVVVMGIFCTVTVSAFSHDERHHLQKTVVDRSYPGGGGQWIYCQSSQLNGGIAGCHFCSHVEPGEVLHVSGTILIYRNLAPANFNLSRGMTFWRLPFLTGN